MKAVLWAAAALFTIAACGVGPAGGPASGPIQVVAAENFWGSILGQVGGEHVLVRSIVSNPGADPHSYDVTASDARLIARARYVVVNGIGYDPWASRLVDANPEPDRVVLTVGDFLGKKEGDNPHVWYSPDSVSRVVDRMAADLKKVDPANAADYDQQASDYKTRGLQAYHDTIATIRQKYTGVPVGASESIFAYLSPALGLNLITPPSYLKAVSEDPNSVSPADKATVQRQVESRQIKVFVYNSQNSAPDVQQLIDLSRRQGIPVTSITETLSPASATFQDWQTNQLQSLLRALGG